MILTLQIGLERSTMSFKFNKYTGRFVECPPWEETEINENESYEEVEESWQDAIKEKKEDERRV